jgi:hypothetical protein
MVSVALPVAITLALLARQKPAALQVDPGLVVIEFAKKTATTNPPEFVFEHAQATYGPSVLTADKLTISLVPKHKHFIADGHVHILDIDGTLDADRLDFDWINRTGSGTNVHMNLQGLMINASRVQIKGNVCELDDIFATPCGNEKQELIAIKAPHASIDAAGDIHILRPKLYLAGKKVLTLAKYTISPNKHATGQPLPSISYSKSSGFSGSWVPSIPISDTLAANGSIHLSQRGRPSEDLLLSQSLLPPTQAPGGFVPYPDLAEHFGYSYFENVYISDPQTERYFVSARRESLSLGTVWNESPTARPVSEQFNKPVDVIFEMAGSLAGLGTYAQLHAQQAQQIGGPSENRVESFNSIALPTVDLLPRLYTDVRFDSFLSIGNAKPYGWGHAQLGLVTRPNRYFRFGVAYTRGGNFGTPLFETDELYRTQSVNGRVDLLLGSHTFSLLLKYDPVEGDWFDTEIQFAQAVGCFEPYVIYRAFPHGYVFGLRLRLDNVVDALRRRGAIKSGPANADDR